MATAPEDLGAPECLFRAMTQQDLTAVAALEQASYAFPWSEQIFRDCLRVGYTCLVVESEGAVAGYGVLSHGAGEAHVLNLCIAEALRSQGVGRALLLLMLRLARDEGIREAFLEVRQSNRMAAALYESLGFERIGLRRGYYQAAGGREDAVVYRLELGILD